MQELELFLGILIGAVIGSAVVLFAYELGKRTAKRKIGFIPTKLEIRSLVMAKSLLTDIHDAALKDTEKDIYSVNGERQYETYEIPFCVSAISKVIEFGQYNKDCW